MPTSKMCDNTQLLTYVAEDNLYGPVISQINRNGTPKLITVPEKERDFKTQNALNITTYHSTKKTIETDSKLNPSFEE